jgi:sterol desaturase/sphingolipid hydroxylase (fatty acid hydroxylase superfamily)
MDSLVAYETLQLWQMAALGAGLAVWLLLETLWPSRPGRSVAVRLARLRRNGALWLVNGLLLTAVLGSSLLYASYWLEVQRVGVLHLFAAPVWLVVVAGVLALDLADYAFHRLSHQVRWLWLLHAVHHSDADVDVTTNLRAHPLHVALTAASKLVGLAAVGVPLWVWMLRELITMPVTQLHHAAVRLPPRIERLLATVIVTPSMHRVHHSPDAEDNNANFGGMLPWWDRWFGTYRPAPPDAPAGFGLRALREPHWHSVWGMCATPIAARHIETL